MNHTQNYQEQQEAKRLHDRISSFLEDFKVGTLLGGSGIRKLRGAKPLVVFATIFSLPFSGGSSGDSLFNLILTRLSLRTGFLRVQYPGKGGLEFVDKMLSSQGAACPFMTMKHIDFIKRGQLQKFLPIGNNFKQWSHKG